MVGGVVVAVTTHALAQARKRYDGALMPSDLSAMREIILKHGITGRLDVRASHCEIIILPYGGQRFKIVFSRTTLQIVTCLPLKGRKTPPRKRKVYRDGRSYEVSRG